VIYNLCKKRVQRYRHKKPEIYLKHRLPMKY